MLGHGGAPSNRTQEGNGPTRVHVCKGVKFAPRHKDVFFVVTE